MVYLLFYVRRKKIPGKYAFWKRKAASVYSWINKDDIASAKIQAESDMTKKGFDILKYQIAKFVPEEKYPKADRFSMSCVKLAKHKGTSYTFDRVSFEELKEIVEPQHIDVGSRYADTEKISIDPINIPKNLRSLIPFAKQWAIGDDKERERYMRTAPFPDKKAFVDTVWPMMDRLQAFHDQNKDKIPQPDEVVLFDMMTEAVAEAHLDVYGNEE